MHGKLYTFKPHSDQKCFLPCMFSMISCCQNDIVMEQHAAGVNEEVYGYKATFCNGMVPMSPVSCFACCEFGPLAAKWQFKVDETYDGEGTRYIGVGSAMAGEVR